MGPRPKAEDDPVGHHFAQSVGCIGMGSRTSNALVRRGVQCPSVLLNPSKISRFMGAQPHLLMSTESEFYAGERVCPADTLGRRRSVLRTLRWLVLLGGLGAAWVKTPEDLKFAMASSVTSVLTKTTSQAVEPVEAPAEAAAPAIETKEIAADPAAEAGEPVQAAPSAEPSSPAEGETGTEAPPAPLPAPKADPGDSVSAARAGCGTASGHLARAADAHERSRLQERGTGH